ncbi:protein kinase [Pseudomonas aeruginosa]|uniref:protein kinase n=1 Tax=Pseudomonas aeruginosa TaxID=287 RepID=UPI0008779EF5|nr:protein kinase [Pseudomonas aeruginosa]
MTLQPFTQPPLSLALGAGRNLPGQAARVRAEWLAPRPGRAPAFLLALLWGRGCANVVQAIEGHLDALFADYACTPEGWPEAQAARQVLASLNMQLYRRRREGEPGVLELAAGLLLVHAGGVHFLQCGAVGLLRYRQGSLQRLGGSGQPLGSSAELALVQHNLTQVAGEPLLLAPQPLLEVADLRALGERCAGLATGRLEGVLQPLLHAPGAVALVLPGALEGAPAAPRHTGWPALGAACPGDCVDGWTLQAACAFGPPGRLFRACDEQGREALLLLAAVDADEAFWQREWALRRCRAESLPRVLSSPRLRRHAFQLFAPPRWPMRSLLDWAPAHLPLEPQCALVLLEQLIDAVRALQRRGVQGLWLAPRQILLDEGGRLLFLPEAAAILPGVARQALPADSVPLAPELCRGEALDGRADQFALAALFYWLLCGRWPSIACPESDGGCRYEPLGERQADLPVGWDGVLARALAPRPEARFEALSEFWLALQKPLAHPQRVFAPRRLQRGVLALVLLLAGAALLVGLAG